LIRYNATHGAGLATWLAHAELHVKDSLAYIDLHTHSTASDGTLSPRELVKCAARSSLSALALTDHDTTAGLAEAADEARTLGIDFLPGVELSCAYPRPGTMHLLGYGIDPNSTILSKTLGDLVQARNERNRQIIKTLNAHGIAITDEHVARIAGRGVVGRPHIAAALIELGVVKTSAQAFSQYLGQGGSAYADKERLTSREAIDLIHSAGGIVSLAHPVQLRKQNRAQLREEIKTLADLGLDAVEVLHSDHPEHVVDMLEGWAERFGLLKTGGSDFHGSNKPHIAIGFAQRLRVPMSYLHAIRERLEASPRRV
jgi:predicted metal-dependent phosphoesterase TrpH